MPSRCREAPWNQPGTHQGTLRVLLLTFLLLHSLDPASADRALAEAKAKTGEKGEASKPQCVQCQKASLAELIFVNDTVQNKTYWIENETARGPPMFNGIMCTNVTAVLNLGRGPPPVCTTTTTTRTTTTTGTTTTVTTSSARIINILGCGIFCAGNGSPWFVKCGWDACATCQPCANIIVPAPATTAAPLPRGVPTVGTSTLTSTTTTTETTSTEVEVVAVATTTTTTVITSTVTVVGSMTCDPRRCYQLSLRIACTWSICVLCPECMGTTTTTETTSSTTITRTSSTRLGLMNTIRSSTSTTLTNTTTRTTTTTSTTITSTSTVTGCQPPSRVFVTKDCQTFFQPGQTCTARAPQHPCFRSTNGIFTLHCPANNIIQTGAMLRSGNYAVQCAVCDVLDQHPEDDDDAPGAVRFSISFGANMVDGVVSEQMILNYAVYMIDNCSLPIGAPLAVVPKKEGVLQGCCLPNSYSADITLDLPNTTSWFRVMVVPNTSVGVMPIGVVFGPIVDKNASAVILTTSGVRRPSLLPYSVLLAALWIWRYS